MAPAARRAKATSSGETARSPSLIHQNEHPQMAPRMMNDAGQGKLRLFVVRRSAAMTRSDVTACDGGRGDPQRLSPGDPSPSADKPGVAWVSSQAAARPNQPTGRTGSAGTKPADRRQGAYQQILDTRELARPMPQDVGRSADKARRLSSPAAGVRRGGDDQVRRRA